MSTQGPRDPPERPHATYLPRGPHNEGQEGPETDGAQRQCPGPRPPTQPATGLGVGWAGQAWGSSGRPLGTSSDPHPLRPEQSLAPEPSTPTPRSCDFCPFRACLLLACLLLAKPVRSTLDAKEGYKTKTASTSSVTLTLT